MTAPTPSLKELFLAALEVAPENRAAWLQRECGADTELRDRLGLMLAAHDSPQSLLDRPGPSDAVARVFEGGGVTTDSSAAVRTGTVIGPYKLLQEIGEGGMGVVYMAEQREPVKRRVALKIIKPGMDTRQVIARFEAERQALSLMDHPNIAKVLDAGTTESGRPFFVMELVNGRPITQYCDEQHLTPRQRLELLLPVCQAIQHAHQKGIIHRDIKPTNILVAEYDQQPVPKVIDFGVAKAVSQSLTEKTMFTGLGQIIGTLEYMSPEQANVNQLDIDTRSDIYSLGVLLYELLTGSTPFDKERLRSAGWDEMLRIIREEEPPKPSTRLSDLSRVGSAHQVAVSDQPNAGGHSPSFGSLASVAAQRQTEPAKLTKLVRGELDWIVMKALEKDRGRRYETANGLAMDIQRYLNDEPIIACPPTAAYRFRKFARRNRTPLVISLVALATIVAISIGSSIAAFAFRNLAFRNETLVNQKEEALVEVSAAEVRARNAQELERDLRHDAEKARNSAILESRRANLTVEMIVKMLAMGNPNDSQGRATDYTVQQMLLDMGASLPKELDEQPAVKAEIHTILARALTHLENDRADHHIEESLRLRSEIYGDTHPKVAESLLIHAMHMRMSRLDNAAAEMQSRRAIEILRHHPAETELMLEAYGQLCKAIVVQNKDREIHAAVAEAIDYAQRNHINSHRRIATMLLQDATACLSLGQTAEAESIAARSIAMQRTLPGMTLLDDGFMAAAFGRFMSGLNRPAEAEKYHRDAVAIFRQYPRFWPNSSNSLVALQRIMQQQGRQAEFRQLALELANQGGVRALAWVATNKPPRGDEEGYRNDCQRLVTLCSNSANQDALEAVTYVCAWRGDALQDWGPVTLLAQRLADVSPQSSQIQTTLGAILYRGGKTEESLKALNQAVAIDSNRQDKKLHHQLDVIRRSLFLALAHHKRGNSLEARLWLVQASSELAEERRRIQAGEASSGYGQHLFHLSRLREEATKVVIRRADELQSLHNEIQAIGSRTEAESDRSGLTELFANDLIQLGDLLTENKEFAQAAEAYRRALVVIERLSLQFPERPEYRAKIASALQALGRKINRRVNFNLAVQALRQSVAVREKLASDFPGDVEHSVALGHTYLFLAWKLDPGTKSAAREQLFRQAAAQFETVQKNESATQQRPFMIANLANTQRELAQELVTQKRIKEAEAAYRQAVELLASVTAEPYSATSRTDTQSLRNSARLCHSSLIEFLTKSSRHEEAAQICEEAIRFYERLAAERPDVSYFREELAKQQAELAKLQEKQ